MNESRRRVLDRAMHLFAAHGFHGTSIRAITRAARVNLGAVTYHFGSKQALYEEVLGTVTAPLRDRIAAIASGPGTPLDRMEAVVRAFFEHLHEHPALPRLIVQQLAHGQPMPEVARATFESNHRTIAALIAEGQQKGSMRTGSPRLMALSIGSQPMMLSLLREELVRAVEIDQGHEPTRGALIDSVVAFVRRGLTEVSTP